MEKQPDYQKELARSERLKRKNQRISPSKRRKIGCLCRNVGIAAGVLLLLLIVGISLLRMEGRRQLLQAGVGSAEKMQMDRIREAAQAGMETAGKAENASAQDMEQEEAGKTEDKPQPEQRENCVVYRGKTYEFNKDIITFLVMGIDQKSELVQEQTQGYEGGSADAIFLAVFNPHRQKIQILALDRNTMTDVDIYDYYGEYERTIKAQINVQHGFGDGTVKSAGYMMKAVSDVFYGLPINGYCAVNMSAVPYINDAVGGVEVTVLDDISRMDASLRKGETVHLMGKQAFWYVKYRDTAVFGSAADRLERQKQYLTAFVRQAKTGLKKDPTLAVTMFQTLRSYMTTDITLQEVAYFAGTMGNYDFGATDIRKVKGKTVQGERFEEFYVDETALYELILEVFYEEVSD